MIISGSCLRLVKYKKWIFSSNSSLEKDNIKCKMNKPCWQFDASLLDPEGHHPVQPPPALT